MVKLTVEKIARMSDEEVYKLSMERPGHPNQRGFMLSLQQFKNEEKLAECLAILLERLGKIEKKQ